MDAYPAIRAKYFAALGDPIQANGLPVSDVVDQGNHFALRAQRVVFQLWKQDVPWAKAGEVTVALGGDIAKEAGALPDPAALQPTAPPAAGAAPEPPGGTVPVVRATFDGPTCELPSTDNEEWRGGCGRGEYQVLIKVPQTIDWAVYPDPAPADFDISVDMRFASGGTGYAGLLFNATLPPGTGPSSGYHLAFESDTGHYRLDTVARNAAGAITAGRVLVPVSSAPTPGFKAGQVNRLRVTRTGAAIALYVNGQPLATVNDSSQRGSAFGLWVGAQKDAPVDVRFDNLTIAGRG
jgi:hypothetical protein